ncbi:serine/threonine protein kinase [Natronosalvus rutilus]|uniref:Serine/threonine protein kinase n=1 Tax=Natronosalvus rutilus TaxID=2953753 RepID=A0A9E7NAQ6_9EURY|nr:serine/threonine-protein kinase [Natronosalvus rutilus]UTF54827.1 serine/threonine protein kinase [Natronosalvus rutilus]
MSTGTEVDYRPQTLVSSPTRIDADLEDFEELEPIGSGGNADVTKVAYHGAGPDTLALKQPRMQGTLEMSALEQFLEEAQTWAKLDDHDHIVGVVDWGSESLPWIALEYMDGGSLYERLGDLDPPEGLWVGLCVARAVWHAHRRGIAHLDIKPENVLFATTAEGTWDVPKVTDWGLAKMLLEHSKSVEGLSPQFAAPEQFDSETYGPPDDITDVYAIGAVVYASLVGEPPFTGGAAAVMRNVLYEQPPTPSDHVDDLPQGTDAVLKKALAKKKADRYESVLDLRRDLEILLERALSEETDATTIAESGDSSAAASASTSAQSNQTSSAEPTESPASHLNSGTNHAQSGAQSQTHHSVPQSPDPGSQQARRVNTETAEEIPDYHYYMVGSLIGGLILGGAVGSDIGALITFAGFVVSIYYFNADLKAIKQSPVTEWDPRRWAYFAGVFVYGLSVPLYLYRRYKHV